jgi:putative ATP-binding cassette transporter
VLSKLTEFAVRGSTFSGVLMLVIPYFKSEDRAAGRTLLAIVITLELAGVWILVLINQWNARFYNALQGRDWDAFVVEVGVFCALAAIYILISVYKLYFQQWLEIRWRRWMTSSYLSKWLASGTHFRMQTIGDAADNPDQRIADDIRLFVEQTVTIGIGLLGACVTLASFIAILWMLSNAAPFRVPMLDLSIPGYLVWAGLLYATVGTALTHLIGRRLIGLYFEQQRVEADFRFTLVRVRESSEQIALLGGEEAEKEGLLRRFARVIGNWYGIMDRQKKLTFFTTSYNQAALVFPYIVASPAYFAGLLQLGGLTQTASAFDRVQSALSFFVTTYRNLAQWRACAERLIGFEAATVYAEASAADPSGVAIARSESRAVEFHDLLLRLPDGTPLVSASDISINSGDRVLLTGPSGAGKSTLFRAIGGIWRFGSGTIVVPQSSHLMILPQRPYFPISPLKDSISYPAPSGSFASDDIAELLHDVGLHDLAHRLTEECHWNRMLSLGEQQRLGFVRAILERPDYLFLDEATACVDEEAESQMYQLLRLRLPNTTTVSIGHRSTLMVHHDRKLILVRDGAVHSLREARLS